MFGRLTYSTRLCYRFRLHSIEDDNRHSNCAWERKAKIHCLYRGEHYKGLQLSAKRSRLRGEVFTANGATL